MRSAWGSAPPQPAQGQVYAARTPPKGRVKRAGPLGDTTPCECSADLARHGPRPRRVARPRAECQRPRGAFVRAIREECLNRLILFGSVGYAAPRCVQAHEHRERNYQGLGNEGRSGLPTDPGRARDGPPLGPRGRLRPRLVCLPGDLDGSSTGSASSRSGRRPVRARFGAVLRHPRQPIPLAVQAGRDPGARTACSGQEHGVDVSSDSSEPPMGSPHRLQGEPRPRTAHLAPEAGSG